MMIHKEHLYAKALYKRMNKKFLQIILLVTLITLSGCAPAATPAPQISSVKLINPLGPLVIPASGISDGAVSGKVSIEMSNWKTIDEATGLLTGSDVPFAVLPVTTAANLKAAGIPLVLLGVHEWKVFYLLAAETSEFKDWSSLAGQTVYMPEARGQTVDVLTRYALAKAGVDPDKSVTFVYAPTQEITALFKEGKVQYAALPEPFVTQALAGTKGKIVLDYQDYWSQESGAKDGIPVAGLFVKSDFLQQHPDVVEDVVKTFSASIDWANAHPEDAVSASSKILPLPAAVMKTALTRLKFQYVPAKDAKEEVLSFLKSMQATYPAGVKAIPDDSFFAK